MKCHQIVVVPWIFISTLKNVNYCFISNQISQFYFISYFFFSCIFLKTAAVKCLSKYIAYYCTRWTAYFKYVFECLCGCVYIGLWGKLLIDRQWIECCAAGINDKHASKVNETWFWARSYNSFLYSISLPILYWIKKTIKIINIGRIEFVNETVHNFGKIILFHLLNRFINKGILQLFVV